MLAKKSFAKPLDRDWEEILMKETAAREETLERVEQRQSEFGARKIMIYIYASNDVPADSFPASLTRDQQKSFRLDEVSSLNGFLNINLGPASFPMVILIRNLRNNRWDHIHYNTSTISPFTIAREYNPIILSLLECTSIIDLDNLILEGREAGSSQYNSQKIQPAPMFIASQTSQHVASSSSAAAVLPAITGDLSLLSPQSSGSRNMEDQLGWSDRVPLIKTVDAFSRLKDRELGSIMSRGEAIFGPGFKKRTYYKYRTFWFATPEIRKEGYRQKDETFTWAMFRAEEKAFRSGNEPDGSPAKKKLKLEDGMGIRAACACSHKGKEKE